MHRIKRRRRGRRPWAIAPDPMFVNCPRALARSIQDSLIAIDGGERTLRGSARRMVGIIVFSDQAQVRYINPYAQQVMAIQADDGDGGENDIRVEIAKLVAQLRESPQTSVVSRILPSGDRPEPHRSHLSMFRVRALWIGENRAKTRGSILVVIEPHQIGPDRPSSLVDQEAA